MNHNAAPKTEIENQPNYTRRRAIAIGAIAAAGIGIASFGAHKATETIPKAPDQSFYTTSVETLELGQGDTVVEAAINGARNIQPDLSLEDQQHITKEAQREYTEAGGVQPGYEVSVRYGEYDGAPDDTGEFGTDFEVQVTPDLIK